MTSGDDLAFRSAVGLAAAIRERQLSSRELLALFLDRIERHDRSLNAVVTMSVERAIAEADAADERTAAGGDLPPLHGLPITVKDALATAGIRSTGGAVELAEHVPTADATAVARLRRAGAIVFAKTNLPRWSGDGQTYNELFGVTNNPWDLTRTPGGSSGGAAASVASGFTSFEVGTDIGGSVRMPSHFTGVWGHKPSFGIVPGDGYLDGPRGGIVEADVNVFGPLTRSPDDLGLVLDVMAGPSASDATAWRLDLPPPRHDDLGSYRIAAWLDDPACPVGREVAEVLDRTVAAAEAAGADIDRRARPDLDLAPTAELGLQLITGATSVSMSPEAVADVADRSGGRASVVQRHHDWLERDRLRTIVRRAWDRFFTRFDVLLCPVVVVPAFPHTTEGNWTTRTLDVDGVERPYNDLVTWTSFIGMAYLPVTTPPLGLSASGLPVSIQVVAPYLHDRTAIDVARRLCEVAGGGYTPPPALR